MGSGQLVANILARREVSRYKIGNRVRVGELEGVIVDVLDTAVLLENAEGVTAIPYARFAAEPVTLLSSAAKRAASSRTSSGKAAKRRAR